jgi:maleylacetoacetate isomerase
MRRLYTFFRSSTSYRLRIALSLKGLEWEAHYVSLPRMEHREQSYMKLNPQGLVPALIEDDGPVLAQSLAIIEYLDETYPDPPLLPATPLERAYVRGLAQIIGCDIHPLNNVRVLKWLASDGKFTEQEVNGWYRHWIAEGLRSFEATLMQHTRFGKFCLDDHLTLAEVCLVPQIANARRFNCPLDDFPHTVAIADAAAEVPAFKAAHPSTQGDAV